MGNGDVADCFVQQDAVPLFDSIEVCAQAILLVLLLEPLEITEVGMDAHQDLEQTGRLRRAPALLTADDLIAPALPRDRFYLKKRLVGPLLCRVNGPVARGDRNG